MSKWLFYSLFLIKHTKLETSIKVKEPMGGGEKRTEKETDKYQGRSVLKPVYHLPETNSPS